MQPTFNFRVEPFEASFESGDETEGFDTEAEWLEETRRRRRRPRKRPQPSPRPAAPRTARTAPSAKTGTPSSPLSPSRPASGIVSPLVSSVKPAFPSSLVGPFGKFTSVRPVRPPLVVVDPVRPRPPVAPPPKPTEPEPVDGSPPEPSSGDSSSSSRPEPATEPPREPAARTTAYFKDSPRLQAVALPPATPISIVSTWPSIRQALASTYNRLGGLMREVANEARIEAQAALGIWYVESAGRTHQVNRAIIRFENHLFYRLWGQFNQHVYDQHFRHGGHNGVPGRSWENHQFRENPRESFRTFHGSQEQEYRVLALARRLAGDEAAMRAISIGGPQILIENYRLIGYASPQEMSNAFQAEERPQVLGFFDYCRHKRAPHEGDLLQYFRNRDWTSFARYYNGSGQVSIYAGRIQNAYEHARQLQI